MVYSAIASHMLPGSYYHALVGFWRDIYKRCLIGICVRDPEVYGESVCRAAKVHRHGAGQQQEEKRGAILVCCHRS